MVTKHRFAGLMVLGVVLSSGCRVESDKHGDRENVKIATPFGGMEVKTNNATVEQGLGLPIYPGAELVKKSDKGDKNNDGAADVNFSFGGFQLRVKAASYRSDDGQEKVTAFYRKALGRYGDVIECQNDKPVSAMTRTAEGLTCADDQKNHIKMDKDLSEKMELKAGSQQHQHIVAIDREEGGTKFGIVALDLPGHITFGGKSGDDDKDHDKEKQ